MREFDKGVSPVRAVLALQIFQPNVETAKIGRFSVYHHQFAVVSVVDLAGEGREMDRHERLFDTKASGSSRFPHQNVDSHARQVLPFAPSGTRPDLSSSKSV